MSHAASNTWPVKGGSTGELVRNYNWSSTSLGPISAWSGHLRATVDNVVNSPVPKVLMWGPDHVMIYNDGYIDIAGGYHPKALGGAVPQIWPEIWDWNRKILQTGFRGEVQGFQDQSMVLLRNGQEEEVFFDLFYTPIRVETGDVGGVLCTVIENTERVAAERRLAEHAEALERQIVHRKNAERQLQLLNETLETRVATAIADRRLAERALVQAQKMETIGKLTGGVAHDFNVRLYRKFHSAWWTVGCGCQSLLQAIHARGARAKGPLGPCQSVSDQSGHPPGCVTHRPAPSNHSRGNKSPAHSVGRRRNVA